MILLIGAWFNEPGYDFSFSHKVSNFIREEIKSHIFPKFGLDKIDPEMHLNMVIATDSKTFTLEVRGPNIRQRAKMIDFGLWLPYNSINNAEYPLESYINYLFEAFEIVFSNFNVPPNAIKSLIPVCKKEILNNPDYAYEPEF